MPLFSFTFRKLMTAVFTAWDVFSAVVVVPLGLDSSREELFDC